MGKDEELGNMAINYRGQKYSKLKKAALQSGELFHDSEFPANNKSLFYSKVDPTIEWKRPNELCKVPQLVVGGVSAEDLNEGELGNTWFVSACSSLAQEPKMWEKVVPNAKEQEWSEGRYAGIFHFQFWRYGQWIDVVVDDLLPTRAGKLVFCHSKSRNEFWSALLEKAYAKLYGDYETLALGYTTDALVDFTGGVAERFTPSTMELNNNEQRNVFFTTLLTAVENKSLLTCSLQCSPSEIGDTGPQGLIKGHTYGVTDMREIKINKSLQVSVGKEILYLVRLRNPWGIQEWTGPWSDNSDEWKAISSKDREKMGITFVQEGEFWMSFDDVLKSFTCIDVCHFVNTAIFSLKKSWCESVMYGEWKDGAKGTGKDRAGGCSTHNTFLYNPQYVFDIIAERDTLMITLEQDDTSTDKQVGTGHRKIGFHIMKVEDNRRYRVHIPGKVVDDSQYLDTRSVFKRINLTKGRYVIVPTTEKPGATGKFMLRLYTGSTSNAKQLEEECPTTGCCVKPYVIVTRIRVIKAEKLAKPQKSGNSMDAYVIVKCEGETVKSAYKKNNLNPEWNFEVIFYRKKPSTNPVIFEIMNNNLIIDDFMCMATLEEQGDEKPTVIELDVFGKGKKEKEIQREGKLSVEITTSDDLAAL